MNLEKWIRPVVVALLFGAFLTGQSRYAMAEETEAETAPPPAVMSAGNPEEKNTEEPEEQAMETEMAKETEKPQGIEMLSAIDEDSTLTMRRTDGLLFSDQSMAQITLLSGEEETRAQSLLSAKIASDFVLSNPDVPFNEEDIRQMTQEIRDNFLAFSAFRVGITGPDVGCGVLATLSIPDSGLSDNSSTGCRNIVFQVSTDWNIAVIDNDELSFDGGITSFSVEGNGSLIFGIAQFPSDWLYSDLNEVMMRRINEVIAVENRTEGESDISDDKEEGEDSSTDRDQEEGNDTESTKAEDALSIEAGDLTLRIVHENGAPFDKGTTIEAGEMDKESAEVFKKAICDETGKKKVSGFTPFQIIFRKADGNPYTLWHLVLEAEGAGDGKRIAVLTRDGKVRISDASSQERIKISSDTITAVAMF